MSSANSTFSCLYHYDALDRLVRRSAPDQGGMPCTRPTPHLASQLLGFNGECRDSLTGHYLLGNGYRAFNPVLMRFNGPDSLSPFAEGGINAYAYCRGDPVNRSDPDGHVEWDVVFGYAWSSLAFLRGGFAFYKAWPQVKKVTLGKAPQPARTFVPKVDATNEAERVLAKTTATVAMSQLISGTLAFSAATARLSGAGSDVYSGLMGPAVVLGLAAFGVQLATPRLGIKLHATLESRNWRKLDKAFGRARIESENLSRASVSRSARQIRESDV